MQRTISKNQKQSSRPAFALIASILILSLLSLIALGSLSLSALESRSTSQSRFSTIAQANAKLALQIALAELQENLGPDQRISATANILDSTPDTSETSGLSQDTSPHILGVWDSWNHWLNAKIDGTTIQDTYTQGRESRFKKWLISYPDNNALIHPKAPTTSAFTFNQNNSVALVSATPSATTSDLIRAGLIKIEDTQNSNSQGNYAWWIGGQNQKANLRMVEPMSTPSSPAEAELSHGTPASINLTDLTGFDAMDTSSEKVDKLIDYNTLELNSITSETLKNNFHDLAVNTTGLITDTRWGGLKKDLNLLFENSQLPAELTRQGKSHAPSPRPLSSDLLAENPQLPNRAFASFEQMHQFYRIYKSQTSPLQWNAAKPITQDFLGHNGAGQQHAALEGYRRAPVILKFYSVYLMFSDKAEKPEGQTQQHYNHDLVYTTVAALWNPYNVPLILPDKQLGSYSLPYKILPTDYSGYKNGSPLNGSWIPMKQGSSIFDMGRDFSVQFTSGDDQPIRFEPGQIRIFSKKELNYGSEGANLNLTPGFDPSAAYGQRLRVYSDKPDDATRWQVALRLNPRWTFDGTSVYWGGNPGAFGNLLRHKDNNYGIPATLGTMFDWTDTSLDYAPLSPTTSAAVATFEPGVREAIPFAVAGISLKTATRQKYELLPTLPDYRSKNWIHGLSAIGLQKMNINYDNENTKHLQRLDHAYQLHFGPVNGQNDLGQFFSRDVTNTLTSLGTGIGGELVNSVPVLELPTVPTCSLPGFAGMRLTPGWYQLPDYFSAGGKNEQNGTALSRSADNTASYVSGVPGVGIGNSFAHPMIPGDKIYAYHDISKVTPSSNSNTSYQPSSEVTDSKAFSDFWDHALLVNDGLWDSWFTSSMVDPARPSASSSNSQQASIQQFLNGEQPLPYVHYQPSLNQQNPQTVANELTGTDGYKKAAAYITNLDAFNVNSTSVTAWRALLSRLQENQITYRDPSGELKIIEAPADTAPVSRFMTAPADIETTDIYNGNNVQGIGRMWTGVRFLTNDQLDTLAEQCVKQVKLRGPFLNLSEFINRRLSTDDLGLSGALQSAIDYDDQNPDPDSINYRYKTANDIITDSDHTFANYPFEQAANGSRFTGAPGYVVQSDILKPLANSLTVRDDTFIIRTYGDSLDTTGKVQARAWCEAIVMRTNQFLDKSNSPETPVTIIDQDGNPTPNPELTPTNQKFGRAFKIISFRWLNESEI